MAECGKHGSQESVNRIVWAISASDGDWIMGTFDHIDRDNVWGIDRVQFVDAKDCKK